MDRDTGVDVSGLAGKTGIITGGANGLGEAYVWAFVVAKSVAVTVWPL